MMRLKLLFPLVVLLALAAPARADWVSDYEAGMKAAGAGEWATVVSKMTAAINAKPNENPRALTYGTIFIAYHPYYYRGVAYFNQGKLEEAIRDLKKATGEGKVKVGSADSVLARAETQLAAQQQPQVAQQPPPAQTTPTTPAQTRPTAPAVDPNLAPARAAARESISAAERKMTEAQRARATTVPEFGRAQELLVDARTKATQADTASDWSAVATVADRAVSTFELAVTKSQIAAQQPSKAQTPLTASATEDALAAKRNEVRRAVQAYFSGEFGESVRAFDRLAKGERDNALLWAFLGASHYYNWYLGGQRDDTERAAAIDAFKSARRNSRNLRLDERYFPSRVRDFYQQAVQ